MVMTKEKFQHKRLIWVSLFSSGKWFKLLFNMLKIHTSWDFSWISMVLASQFWRNSLMYLSILGSSCSFTVGGPIRSMADPLICLWVHPLTAAILRLPNISNMDCGYPGTSPFASFKRIYLLSSGSMQIMVGHPNICDLKTFPYLRWQNSKSVKLYRLVYITQMMYHFVSFRKILY